MQKINCCATISPIYYLCFPPAAVQTQQLYGRNLHSRRVFAIVLFQCAGGAATPRQRRRRGTWNPMKAHRSAKMQTGLVDGPPCAGIALYFPTFRPCLPSTLPTPEALQRGLSLALGIELISASSNAHRTYFAFVSHRIPSTTTGVACISREALWSRSLETADSVQYNKQPIRLAEICNR